jgi:hypothetical protein
MYPVTVGTASFIGQWRIVYETMMAASGHRHCADHRPLHVPREALGAGAGAVKA